MRLPLSIALFAIAGPFLTDGLYLYSGLAFDLRPGFPPSYPTIDPNAARESFALGARATFELMHGQMPLWNHYEGLGTPLLGAMQSAALFPFTWLLALPHGQVLEHAALQFIAGLGAFLFFRTFGLVSAAALAGALTFELNGVFAWLRNAVYNPVAFLPWLFLVIEAARAAALADAPLRQRLPTLCLGGVMAALAAYAGFPEVVYLCTLLLIAWTVFRSVGLSAAQVTRYAIALCLMGAIAIALAAPLLVAFYDLVQQAELGGHDGNTFAGHGSIAPRSPST